MAGFASCYTIGHAPSPRDLWLFFRLNISPFKVALYQWQEKVGTRCNTHWLAGRRAAACLYINLCLAHPPVEQIKDISISLDRF